MSKYVSGNDCRGGLVSPAGAEMTGMCHCAVKLPLPAEWASSVVIDLPGAKPEIHRSVMPDVLRVMAKGAKVSISHRDKDADTKAWIDRLVILMHFFTTC